MGIKVVAIDNSEELLDKIARILKEMKEVELLGSFSDAVTAMQYIKEHPVQLVFSDVVMPDISGITLAAKLYELANPPEVVLLSGIPGFSLEAWKIKAYGFIIKPYKKPQIKNIVDQYIVEYGIGE